MSTSDTPYEISLIEKGVLAAVLDDAEVAGVVAEILDPLDFVEPRNETIFRKVMQFYTEGRPFDILQMTHSLAEEGQLNLVGGLSYFMELLDVDALHANADPITYASIVKEASDRRSLSLVGANMQQQAQSGSGMNSDDIVAYMQANVQKFAEGSFGGTGIKLSDCLDDEFSILEDNFYNGTAEADFIPTGFVDLDASINGLAPGQMIIIAGRPGMGKTTLALDFARNAAFLSDKTVLFFSLEMRTRELLHKLWAAEAHVPHKKIRAAKDLTEEDWRKLGKAKEKLANANFYVDDSEQLDFAMLRAKCLKQKARADGLDLVILDYLQLMDAGKGNDPREQKIAAISRGVKNLAKELDCPIIVLAQLNRGSVNRPDKTPVASDLRESGSLEQDADVVILLNRPEVFDPNNKPGITEIIVDKVRAGERGTIDVISLLAYSKFGNGVGKYAATEQEIAEHEDAPPPPPEEDVFSADFPEDTANQGSQTETAELIGSEPETGGSAW